MLGGYLQTKLAQPAHLQQVINKINYLEELVAPDPHRSSGHLYIDMPSNLFELAVFGTGNSDGKVNVDILIDHVYFKFKIKISLYNKIKSRRIVFSETMPNKKGLLITTKCQTPVRMTPKDAKLLILYIMSFFNGSLKIHWNNTNI